jgi:glycosyltransferase involved in cell wall biosynthesis
MRELRLLTFNWHETYLHLLASVGYRWDVVLRQKGGRSDWWHEVRPMPEAMHVVSEEEALSRLADEHYDAVVCHNLLDLGLVVDSDIPTFTVFHTSRDLEIAFGLDVRNFERLGCPLLDRTSIVFVSAMKQASWGLPGAIIPPGLDVADYGGYSGEAQRILHVGNLKRELASVNGMAQLESAAAGLPFTLLGLNPTIPGARLSTDWDDLRGHFRSHRAYLHTSTMPYEDGYNLAMLEAMATGMPVVALAHPTSPLTSGVDGLVARDVDGLRIALLELLEDADRARELGGEARRTVARLFPIERFRQQWQELLEGVTTSARRSRGGGALARDSRRTRA